VSYTQAGMLPITGLAVGGLTNWVNAGIAMVTLGVVLLLLSRRRRTADRKSAGI
jgi:hypothetical protein